MQDHQNPIQTKTFFRRGLQKVIPWAVLASVFPAIIAVNMLFLTVFPAHPKQHIGVWDALNPANSQIQSLYIYNSRNPDRLFGNFYYTLGTQLAARGQIASAETMLSKAVPLLPENNYVRMNYGIVLEALGKNEEALTQYQEAINIDPKMVQGYYSLGLLQDKMGRLDAGMGNLKKAISLDPDNNFINYDLGVLYAKKGDYENSAIYSKKALDGLGVDFAEAYNNYGYALAQMGKYQESLDAVEKSLALKPESAATLDSKGYALMGLGRHQEALKAFNEALKLDPTIGEIYLHLGQAQEKLNNYADAVKAYETYLQLTPEASDRPQIEAKIKTLRPSAKPVQQSVKQPADVTKTGK